MIPHAAADAATLASKAGQDTTTALQLSDEGGKSGMHDCVQRELDTRSALLLPFFTRECGRIAELCQAMAQRFLAGGRLIAIGESPAACSDVRHIVVEFVHPVIVGKRALPALGITGSLASVAQQLEMFVRPADIVFAMEDGSTSSLAADAMRRMIGVARARGCLTACVGTAGTDWDFAAPTQNPFIWQELGELLYHLLWELVHVFFDHESVMHQEPHSGPHSGARDTGQRHDSPDDIPAAGFLYPFLNRTQYDVHAVKEDVKRSVLLKAQEAATLQQDTVGDIASANRRALLDAAVTLRNAFAAGGSLLVLGNGGSATDAMDAAADYRFPPPLLPSPLQARRALDLTEDTAIITALANDIGAAAIFSRQIIAHASANDVVMAFSTSGNSRSVVQALEEARRRKVATIVFAGYDGGDVARAGVAQHLIISASQHVPRIQEAQAAAHHLLRTLVG